MCEALVTADDKKPSRRAKQGAKSQVAVVAPVVAKVAGELSGVPYVGPLVGALADLVTEHIARTKEAAHQENERRLATLYAEILTNDTGMDEQVAAVMVDDEDFHALLRACLADIEAEKVRSYANLAREIASGSVAKQWRRHFILSLRELSAGELERLRGAWVAGKHQLIPAQGPSMGQEHFLDPGHPGSLQAISLNNLASRGLIHEGKLSKAGEAFAAACFRPADLTPASIGFREWSVHNIAIICYEMADNSSLRLSTALQDRLRRVAAKASIIAVKRTNVQHVRMFHTMGVLLFQRRSKHLVENLQHLENFVRTVPTLLVDLSEHSADVPDVPFFMRVDGSSKDPAALVTEVCQCIAGKSRELAAQRRP